MRKIKEFECYREIIQDIITQFNKKSHGRIIHEFYNQVTCIYSMIQLAESYCEKDIRLSNRYKVRVQKLIYDLLKWIDKN